MANCRQCGDEVILPFICNYCGGIFCTEHRLPEAHNCTGIFLARSPSITRSMIGKIGFPTTSEPITRRLAVGSEAQQILLAWLVLSICFSAGYITTLGSFALRFVISLVTVGLGFVFHELAHRYMAKRYGCWASFRIWPMGLGLALLLAFLSRGSLIFAAPGAVYISPKSGFGISSKQNGIISTSGIAMNILLASIFLLLSGLGGIAESIGALGATINLWLAAFNLIPISQLDGAKVLAWSWKVWLIATAIAWLGLTLVPSYLFG